MIDNTSERMKNPAEAMIFLAASMGRGGASQAIEEQEAAGQAQLVNSDRLPTELHSPREDFEAAGFTFGDPDPGDPLFAPATLPEGWKREGSDHAMWSYLTDQLGRRRVSIFYKAAFYDRDAFMSLTTVHGYVWDRVAHDKDIVTDDTWATPAAVAEAARTLADREEDERATWAERATAPAAPDYAAEYATEHTTKRDKYRAIAQRYAA